MGLLGGLSPGGSIALGIVVGVLSTSVQSLGLTLQRKSHILEDEKAPHLVRRPPHRRRRWQIGMAMFLIANLLGSSIQISTLPLPVLSTLQASGLVFNSICATLILGEPFTRWSLWGTLLVCSGAVLIAIFGAIPAPAHNLDELLALLVRPAFVAWMSLQAIIVLAIVVFVELASTLFFAAWAQTSRYRLARGLAYGCISGILSAHSLLVAKSAVELVVRTIADGANQFNHWQAWALVTVFVVLALTQLYYLHRGLRLVSTSVLYPLVFCTYNIFAILDGLIFFRQTDQIGPLRACLISLGTVVLLLGVLALSWRLSDDQHPTGVGQSSLAPGLGMIEDTEGEEEEVADSEDTTLPVSAEVTVANVSEEEQETSFVPVERQSLLPPSKYVSSYQTFGPKSTNGHSSSRVVSAGAALASVVATTDGGALPPVSERDNAVSQHPVSPRSPTLSRRRAMAPAPFSSDGASRDGVQLSPSCPPRRWTERAEIWDELEDQDDGHQRNLEGMKRHRSSTLPMSTDGGDGDPQTPPSSSSQHAPLSPFSAARRGISSGSPSLLRHNDKGAGRKHRVDNVGSGSPLSPQSAGDEAAVEDAGTADAYRRSFRRRRHRTTGFPGFQARQTKRRSGSGSGDDGGNLGSMARNGLQGTLDGLWRHGWWTSAPDSTERTGAVDDGHARPAWVSRTEGPARSVTPPSKSLRVRGRGASDDDLV